MIRNKAIAKEISALMLEFGARLDASVALVQKECAEEDFKEYRLAVGTIMGGMLTEIMNPLYQAHPDLKPKELV